MALQEEIKQKVAFRSIQEEAFLNLYRTTRLMLDRWLEFFKAYELTDSTYNVLRILRGAGDEGLSCGDIGQRMVHRDPDVTRLCDRLEARGLVERSRSSEDRRVRRVQLTKDGLELVNRMQTETDQLHVSLLSHMDDESLRQMIGLLERARERLTSR
jgi:DNA-binding MarR family transcriptional regulator